MNIGQIFKRDFDNLEQDFGHKLEILHKTDYTNACYSLIKCVKCNSKYYIDISVDNLKRNKSRILNVKHGGLWLKLTCNEMIVKNIIE